MLVASNHLKPATVADAMHVGLSLQLDGSVRHVHGDLRMAFRVPALKLESLNFTGSTV